MTQKSTWERWIASIVAKKMSQVGMNIKLARKRLGLTMQDMAKRMFVTRKTLNRLESGDPGVSFGILTAALLALGLENDLSHLAKPENDLTANIIDKQSYDQKKRIRPTRKIDLDF